MMVNLLIFTLVIMVKAWGKSQNSWLNSSNKKFTYFMSLLLQKCE